MAFRRRSAKFDDWLVDEMPARCKFDVSGTTYDLRAFVVNPPIERFPLQHPVWTRFRCNFLTPRGVEIEIVGRASYRTKSAVQWGVRTDYYSVREAWTFSVSVDGMEVANDLRDAADIGDERLRNLVYEAHAAIGRGCAAYQVERRDADRRQAASEREAAARLAEDRQRGIDEKLNKL